MSKMHLIARVPNEGARRLAWWVADRSCGSIPHAARRLHCEPSIVERLIAGEIVPGGVLATSLLIEAGIQRTDWQRPAQGGWFEAPEGRRRPGISGMSASTVIVDDPDAGGSERGAYKTAIAHTPHLAAQDRASHLRADGGTPGASARTGGAACQSPQACVAAPPEGPFA